MLGVGEREEEGERGGKGDGIGGGGEEKGGEGREVQNPK